MTAAVSDTPPHEGILKRIAGELTRVVALQIVGALLVQVAGFALARLLVERDFGVYAIGVFFLGVGSLLGDEGIAAALLIKRDALTDEECEVAVTFLLALGLAMATAFLAGSGVIARLPVPRPSALSKTARAGSSLAFKVWGGLMTNIPLARSPWRRGSPGAPGGTEGVSSAPMANVACSQGRPACLANVFRRLGRSCASGRGITGYQTR